MPAETAALEALEASITKAASARTVLSAAARAHADALMRLQGAQAQLNADAADARAALDAHAAGLAGKLARRHAAAHALLEQETGTAAAALQASAAVLSRSLAALEAGTQHLADGLCGSALRATGELSRRGDELVQLLARSDAALELAHSAAADTASPAAAGCPPRCSAEQRFGAVRMFRSLRVTARPQQQQKGRASARG